MLKTEFRQLDKKYLGNILKGGIKIGSLKKEYKQDKKLVEVLCSLNFEVGDSMI